jgi:hypothetical protein
MGDTSTDSELESAWSITERRGTMATRRTANLTAVISSIVISIACGAGPSSTYGEELILVHLNNRTGDIEKVEHQSEDGKKIEKRRDFFYPSQGLIRLYSFPYSVMKFLDPKPRDPAMCCPWGGRCLLCHQVETVIAALRYDRQRNEFNVSLNSISQGKLKELEKGDFDPSHRAMRPLTRSYHLAVMKSESPAGLEFWVIDESKEEV